MSTTRETVSDLPRDLIARSLFCSLVLADNPITKILARLDSGNVTDSHTYFRLNWPILFFERVSQDTSIIRARVSNTSHPITSSFLVLPRPMINRLFLSSFYYFYLFIYFIYTFVIYIYSSNKFIKWNDCFLNDYILPSTSKRFISKRLFSGRGGFDTSARDSRWNFLFERCREIRAAN